jgi:hypothetical protein
MTVSNLSVLLYLPNIHSQITSLSYNRHQNNCGNRVVYFDLPTHPALRRTFLAIPCNFDPDSNLTEESDLHPAKQFTPKISTDAGRITSTKAVPQNASLSIRDNLDRDLNVTDESDSHSEKHISPKNSTDAGITISTKQAPRNASPSILDNLDPDSNVTEESDLH